jgi:hypothetical protein
MASATRVWIALLSMLATSCRASIPDERRQEGRYIEVYSSASRMPCRASIDYADQFIEHWSRRFEIAPPRVRSFVDQGLRDQTCGRMVEGTLPECARGTETFSAGWVQEHELVHAIAYSGFGRSPALFEEGLAVWASEVGDHNGRYPGRQSVDLGPLFESSAWDAAPNAFARYEAAGHFVGYVVQRFGLRAFLRVYDALDYASSRGTIESIVLQLLGVSLDVLLVDWMRSTERPPVDAIFTQLLCAQAPRASSEILLAASDSTCSSDILQAGIEHRAVLQAPPGVLRFRSTDRNQSTVVGDCDRNAVLYDRVVPSFFFTAFSNTLVATKAGVDVRVDRVSSVPTRCEDAVVLDVESTSFASIVADPRSWARVGTERRTWIRVRHATAPMLRASVVYNVQMPQSDSTLLVCDSCATNARCVPLGLQGLTVSTNPSSQEVLVWSTTDAAITVELALFP